MKKLLTLSFILPFAVFAQVPNSDFEQIWGCGGALTNWGTFFTQVVVIDSTGEGTFDNIIYDGGYFSGPVTDANSGSFALEIRNAYNETTEQVLPGNVVLFDTANAVTEPNGWNHGVPLPENTEVTLFGFHYKFLPVGNDVVRATMEVFGESELIGRVEIFITEAADEYTYVAVPMVVESAEAPVRIMIEFDMAAPGSSPSFGSRFIVDDLFVNEFALEVNEHVKGSLTVWPTVATSQINISDESTQKQISEVVITDASGKVALHRQINISTEPSVIDVSTLAKGTYYLAVENASGTTVSRFIRQ